MIPRFNHNLKYVEYTKLLERTICDTLTFTNPIGKESAGTIVAEGDVTWTKPKDGGKHWMLIYNPEPAFLYPFAVDSQFTFEALESFVVPRNPNGWNPEQNVYWASKAGMEIIAPDMSAVSVFATDPLTYKFTQTGNYQIIYRAWVRQDKEDTVNADRTITYNVTAEPLPIPKPWTIKTVIERILSVGKTRREGIDPQIYVLDEEQAELFDQIASPEFFFSNCTYFDALLQVGKYIHYIPRLYYPTPELIAKYGFNIKGVVRFDKLGGNEIVEPKGALISQIESRKIDDYCGALDSTVENMQNSLDPNQGGTTFPSGGGLNTIRTAEGNVKISNDTAILGLFNDPIAQSYELIFNYNDWGEREATNYLYEASEYAALLSFEGAAYPFSIAYAIRYTIGGQYIDKLMEKIQEPTGTATAWSTPAIFNILKRIYPEYASEISTTDNLGMKLKYRFRYRATVTARLVQKKSTNEFPLDNTLFFNQQANSVEALYYGESMKGAIATMGNALLMETRDFVRPSDIPKVGQLRKVYRVDGTIEYMYVCDVSLERGRLLTRATISMTPNFNRVYQFFSVNSEYRLYDVSERQSVRRLINYGEDVIVGNRTFTASHNGITEQGLTLFSKVFAQDATDIQVSSAYSQGISSIGTKLNGCLLPCTSLAIGNSLSFIYNYRDNYGAGYQSSAFKGDEEKALRVQRNVPYGDGVGGLQNLAIRLCGKVSTGDRANALPQWEGDLTDVYFDYSQNPLIVQKNGAEALGVTIQQHFISDKRRNIVFGTQLMQNNPLVTVCDASRKAKIVFLSYRLNMLDDLVDLRKAITTDYNVTELIETDVDNKKVTINLVKNTTESTFQSWGLFNPANNRLYLGENLDLPPQSETLPIVFNF